jgi:hypothetical protein
MLSNKSIFSKAKSKPTLSDDQLIQNFDQERKRAAAPLQELQRQLQEVQQQLQHVNNNIGKLQLEKFGLDRAEAKIKNQQGALENKFHRSGVLRCKELEDLLESRIEALGDEYDMCKVILSTHVLSGKIKARIVTGLQTDADAASILIDNKIIDTDLIDIWRNGFADDEVEELEFSLTFSSHKNPENTYQDLLTCLRKTPEKAPVP